MNRYWGYEIYFSETFWSSSGYDFSEHCCVLSLVCVFESEYGFSSFIIVYKGSEGLIECWRSCDASEAY